jgi:hypothetical protein
MVPHERNIEIQCVKAKKDTEAIQGNNYWHKICIQCETANTDKCDHAQMQKVLLLSEAGRINNIKFSTPCWKSEASY